MLTSGIMGIALVVAIVFILGSLGGETRRRRATSDGGAGWTGNGGPDCDTGSGGGCDGGGGGD